jgi:hypothetical protein
MVTKGSFEDGDKYFYILKVDFIKQDIRLNLILYIAIKQTIYVAKFVLVICIA